MGSKAKRGWQAIMGKFNASKDPSFVRSFFITHAHICFLVMAFVAGASTSSAAKHLLLFCEILVFAEWRREELWRKDGWRGGGSRKWEL